MLVLVSISTITPSVVATSDSSYGPLTTPIASGLKAALEWLATNESSDGSYGAYFDHWTAAGAYALWLNDTQSTRATKSYSWLATQIDNPAYWYWGAYGEADVPGAVLFSIAVSNNLRLIRIPSVASNLLQFQSSNGGFKGYYDSATQQSVTSSVDTAEAVHGLINAGAFNSSSRQSAVNYLFTLQNPDGSFNLTSSRSYDPIYSQGPEPVSITAMVLLALRDASYSINDSRVSKAVHFLATVSSKGFSVVANDASAVYSASLSALTFNVFGRNTEALTGVSFILSHQNHDGGLSDSIRSSSRSNALDTGWAAIALQQVVPERAFGAILGPLFIIGIVIGVGVLAIAVGVAVYLVRRNRTRTTKLTL